MLHTPSRASARPFFLTCAAALALSSPAAAQMVESQVGVEAVGGVGLEQTLTGGFTDKGKIWFHVYDPIPGEIVRATLQVDLIDADTGVLELYAGQGIGGVPIGVATGIDHGDPGPWRDLQSDPPLGSVDNEVEVGPEHFANLADGEFQVYGRNLGLGIWGSNSALLTIEYVMPLEVVIDVRPHSDGNRIDPRDRGIVPVAVLGSEDLDVAVVAKETLAFGPLGAPLSYHGAYARDVNGDELLDLVGFFRVSETGIAEGDTEACLAGALLDGLEFEACDAIDTSPLDWREILRGMHRFQRRHWHGHRGHGHHGHGHGHGHARHGPSCGHR